MSPVPVRGRYAEYATKGMHLALRRVAQAPEQRRARRLAQQAATLPAPTGKRVAILSMRDWAAHVQWEAMIGHGLRLRGADVRFISCGGGLHYCDRTSTWEAPPMPCHSCTKYVHDSLAAHGFTVSDLRPQWERDDEPWPELDLLHAHELLDVEADGLKLGRLAEIPTKWFLLTTQILTDPTGPHTLRQFLRSARRIARAFNTLFDEMQPDTVVLLNGLFLFESIAKAVCDQRGIDVVNYERGFIKETLFFARDSLACFGEVDDVWATYRSVPLLEAERSELRTYMKDRTHGRRAIEQYWTDVHFDEVPRTTKGRRVALFTNLTWDSAVINKEIAYPSIQDWLTASVEFFATRPDDELVIRVHPAEVKLSGKPTREPMARFLHQRFPTLPPNVLVIEPDDPISSYPLMASSDAVSVFTSTTGLEAALAGTPVIVAGQTHYRNKGFTIDVSSPSEYEAALAHVVDDPGSTRPDIDLVERYAYLFFFRLPIASPGVSEHVQGLARLDITELDALGPGRHGGLDRICDGILHGGNFRP